MPNEPTGKKSSSDNSERVYVVPATSFHFGRPSESYLVYDNHRKMLSDLFAGSRKYYCAEDIKQDLMSLAAPIAPCSTYDETARVGFALFDQCDTLEQFQEYLEGWLKHPDAQLPSSMIVPTFPKSEVGRSLLQPATELSRGCFAACAVAVAVLVCMASSCVLGAIVRDLHPERFKLPDYARRDTWARVSSVRDRVKVSRLKVR